MSAPFHGIAAMAKAKEKAPEEAADGAAEGGEAPPKKKRSLVKMGLFFGLPILLVLGGAAYFSLFMAGEEPAEGEAGAEHAEAPPPVFVDLPDMLVNLTAAGGERAILKLVVALEVADAWQGKGIGYILMNALFDAAREQGLKVMRGEVLAGNKGMLKLMHKLGFTVEPHPEDRALTLVTKDLAV